ncbi:protein FMC1 homolog [Chionomys nivalis]|uniref:protein FMC1 homolog n=1 Tax=Chionomys nivalis TaxID=269649 RepID=UPI002596CAFC|nr:protein FMC1 homolog [Chionomys nivalis]
MRARKNWPVFSVANLARHPLRPSIAQAQFYYAQQQEHTRFSPECQRPPANGRPKRRRQMVLRESLPLRFSSQRAPGVSLARRRTVDGAVERTGAAVPASAASRGTRLAEARRMAALGSPARTLRGLLRELRYLNAATGRPYRDTAAYRYLVKTFRAHRVTSEKLCRAQHELHFQAATYLCLLRSIRQHVALHQEFHGKGERSVEESAGLVGLQLPRQPGGKGWEP